LNAWEKFSSRKCGTVIANRNTKYKFTAKIFDDREMFYVFSHSGYITLYRLSGVKIQQGMIF